MEKQRASEVLKHLEGGYHLRPLSPVAMKLVELASDEEASIRQMAALIEKEPSLAVRVLHLANSAAFGFSGRVSTLSQAIVKLGVHRLKIMALSISLRDVFPMGKVGSFDYESFWKVSLYRGLMARSLADRSRTCNAEEAFLAALTLEVGLPIFFDMYGKQEVAHLDFSVEPLEDILMREIECVGIDHRQIGKAALKFWKFPESVIACQSVYGDAANKVKVSLLCRISELSRLFSRMLLDPAADFSHFFLAAEAILKLRQPMLQEIFLKTFDDVQETAEVLRLEVSRERDLMDVMERANRALIRISQKMSRSCTGIEEKPLPTLEVLDAVDESTAYTLQAVAHEIRNPLTAVGGFARRLAQSVDEASKIGVYAQVILEEAKRLEAILAQMI